MKEPWTISYLNTSLIEDTQNTLVTAIYSAIAENSNAEKLIEATTMVKLKRFTTNYRLENPTNERYFQLVIKPNYEKWQARLKVYKN